MVRSAAQLDIEVPEQLIAYLQSTNRISSDELPQVQVLHGGVSGRTVLVERENGESWVLKQALERLRVAGDWFSDPRRIEREADGMRALNSILAPGRVPDLIFEDKVNHLVAMQAVDPPFTNWKELLLTGRLTVEHVVDFGRLLAQIHEGSARRSGQFRAQFEDKTVFDTLRVDPYYRKVRAEHPEYTSFFDAVIEESLTLSISLVHGDYSPKNILMRPTGCVLVDHEVIHWGDPAFDVGFSITHLLAKSNHMPRMRSRFGAAALTYWQTYQAQLASLEVFSGVEERSVRHAAACLLARVDGKSPLEYLDDEQRVSQRAGAMAIISAAPTTVAEMIACFLDEISDD